MTWGFFSIIHIITLILGVAIIAALYFILRGKSDNTKIAVLAVLSFSGIAAIIFNLVSWGSPLEYLPLHLCSLNALVLPVAVITKNKTLNNLLLLWSVGALFALIMNTSVSEASIFSWVFVFYYFPHVLEFGIPILMFLFKLTRKDVKCIGSTMIITVISYTAIHFINLIINNYCEQYNILDSASNVIEVNYMFSISPENPLLDLFYSIIPYSYWYMYLSFAVIALYLGAVYFKDIIKLVAKRNKA
jgi:uncharacterized membrane protein YwaF